MIHCSLFVEPKRRGVTGCSKRWRNTRGHGCCSVCSAKTERLQISQPGLTQMTSTLKHLCNVQTVFAVLMSVMRSLPTWVRHGFLTEMTKSSLPQRHFSAPPTLERVNVHTSIKIQQYVTCYWTSLSLLVLFQQPVPFLQQPCRSSVLFQLVLL